MHNASTEEIELAKALSAITLSENNILKELTQKLTTLDTEYLESINNLVDLLIKKEQS